jgi:hypothetical protein
MTEEEVNKAIARVILSTKRKSRQYSLLDIATDIDALKEAKGGMQEISKIIGVSAGMLSQFLSVFKLPKPVIQMVKERKIDSVSVVHNLSRFNEEDILNLAELLVSKKLSSQDLRVLIPYRKQYLNESIINLVEKIHLSKNIKVSVIKIDKNDTTKTINELDSHFATQVGRENLLKIETNKNNIDIKLTKQGEKILRQRAKQNKKSLQELITSLIN